MEIKTKYNIGDTVYTSYTDYDDPKCPTCDGFDHQAPYDPTRLRVTEEKIEISDIQVSVVKDSIEISYFFVDQPWSLREDGIFLTAEEAIAYGKAHARDS